MQGAEATVSPSFPIPVIRTGVIGSAICIISWVYNNIIMCFYTQLTTNNFNCGVIYLTQLYREIRYHRKCGDICYLYFSICSGVRPHLVGGN